jgi:hypothetical protein
MALVLSLGNWEDVWKKLFLIKPLYLGVHIQGIGDIITSVLSVVGHLLSYINLKVIYRFGEPASPAICQCDLLLKTENAGALTTSAFFVV